MTFNYRMLESLCLKGGNNQFIVAIEGLYNWVEVLGVAFWRICIGAPESWISLWIWVKQYPSQRVNLCCTSWIGLCPSSTLICLSHIVRYSTEGWTGRIFLGPVLNTWGRIEEIMQSFLSSRTTLYSINSFPEPHQYCQCIWTYMNWYWPTDGTYTEAYTVLYFTAGPVRERIKLLNGFTFTGLVIFHFALLCPFTSWCFVLMSYLWPFV